LIFYNRAGWDAMVTDEKPRVEENRSLPF